MNRLTPGQNIIALTDLKASDRSVAGAKAANLGDLLRVGFPVPQGFVITDDPSVEELAVAMRRLGKRPVAVRSSAVAEDLEDASFAGQYDSVLGVAGMDELLLAVQRVRASGLGLRVQSYSANRRDVSHEGIPVLVQEMLTPESAGVAFTANPITGDRGEVIVTGAMGLGERVVAGEAIGDEWSVRNGTATCRRFAEGALDDQLALEIADIARRIEAHFGTPQDIEWAVEQGKLYVLQARPMTALSDPLQWTPPEHGYWMRNFRLGEWLPEPLTPLFRDWLMERIEEGFRRGMQLTVGAAIPFRHTVIHGWYYTSPPNLRTIPSTLIRAAIRSRGRIFKFAFNGLIRVSSQPELADRALLGGLARDWRMELLPRYQHAVTAGLSAIGTMSMDELETQVDDLGRLAGEYLWSLAIVGGSAWKMEGCLTRFLRRELPADLRESAPSLLRGLAGVELETPPHAVQSADWYWPTVGEVEPSPHEPDLNARRKQLSTEREAAEAACRKALLGRPNALAKFDALLEVSQRYAVLREEQSRWFTLGWPLLRLCAQRIGEWMQERGVISEAEDVFFVTKEELRSTIPLDERVTHRRQEWERQRRLTAPLAIGTAPRLMQSAMGGVGDAARNLSSLPDEAIIGEPASPGRASGPVRIVHGPEDFDGFQRGDVLVARTTAPAWTPLFGLAAAVVTDAGTLAAHASLVAREYGIPAVVATSDATSRLRTGQLVTVDGRLGVVLPGTALK